MSPDNAPSASSLRLTWWLWIAASALVPVLVAILYVLVQRETRGQSTLQGALTIYLMMALAVLPPVVEWAVLRRVAKDLMLSVWFGVFLLSAVIAFFLLSAVAGSVFRRVEIFVSPPGSSLWGSPFFIWSWVWLATESAIVVFIRNALPITVFGWFAKRSAMPFLGYTILGAIVADLLYRFYFYGFHPTARKSLFHGIDFQVAQYSWDWLVQHLAAIGLFGAVQGTISGYGLMRMFASEASSGTSRDRRIASLQIFAAIALLLFAAHGVRYTLSPMGYRAGFPAIRQAFSVAPAENRSHGAPILKFSHKIDLPVPVWASYPSPDGRTAILNTKEYTRRRLDVETGALTSFMGDERATGVAWSPDGHILAVNQRGHVDSKTRLGMRRIRLLSGPSLEEIGEFWADDPSCPLDGLMTFSGDGQALWVACRYESKPQEFLAAKLSLPDLQIVDRKRPPETPARWSPRSIIATDSEVAIASVEARGLSRTLHIAELATAPTLLISLDATSRDRGGPGFGDCGYHLSQDFTLVTVANCALIGGAILDEDYRKHYEKVGQFRTFDILTSKLTSTAGRQVEGHPLIQWSLAFDRTHGRLVGVGPMLGTKRGLLVIWDQKTGQELQRIETRAYRAGHFSGDGKTLLLLGRDDDTIHVYRADDAASRSQP